MNFNIFFYIFYYCQIRRGCRQNVSFLVLQKPLLVHICVMVWTLFIVFSFCFSTKSIIFGVHTPPQHQETTKIVNFESLVLGVVKNHNCWFAFLITCITSFGDWPICSNKKLPSNFCHMLCAVVIKIFWIILKQTKRKQSHTVLRSFTKCWYSSMVWLTYQCCKRAMRSSRFKFYLNDVFIISSLMNFNKFLFNDT